MRFNFTDFQIVEVTADTLVVQMNAGMVYTLRRGLDHQYPERFKLEINGEFFRTPTESGQNAIGQMTGQQIAVEFTSGNLRSITSAGW